MNAIEEILKIYTLANHAGLDSVNQNNLLPNPQRILDFYFKIAGLVCGPLVISDTMLLDHSSLGEWIMSAEGAKLDYISPNDPEIIPAIIVSTRNNNSFGEILTILLKNQMLFSSQSLPFDDWLQKNPGPSLEVFFSKDEKRRSMANEKWWETYLARLDWLFAPTRNIRIAWPFGPFDYPSRLRELLKENSEVIKDKEPLEWDYLDDFLKPENKIDRSKIIRYLRSLKPNNYFSTISYDLLQGNFSPRV